MKLKISLLLFAFIAALSMPLLTHAAVDLSAPLNSAKTGIYGAGVTVTDLPTQIGGYIKVALGILGIMLVIIIVYAGFLWATAGGDPDAAKKAREWIINAVIGMVIVVSAYTLTSFVIGKLISVSGGAGGSGTTQLKSRGAACTNGNQCSSNYCVNDFCT